DLHANIGTGFLGLRAFHNVVNEPRFAGLPLVLETPIEVRDDDGVLIKDEKGKEKEDKGIWAREIKLLENLVGMDVESKEFLDLERILARKGEPERKRLEEQIERTFAMIFEAWHGDVPAGALSQVGGGEEHFDGDYCVVDADGSSLAGANGCSTFAKTLATVSEAWHRDVPARELASGEGERSDGDGGAVVPMAGA
ncbi:DNA-(apurinic or apyrimidinic site) lyase, partial [Rachicladosporium monterosium]